MIQTSEPPRPMTTEAIRQFILITARANGIPVDGDLWLSLVFRSRSELIQIASELHIVF